MRVRPQSNCQVVGLQYGDLQGLASEVIQMWSVLHIVGCLHVLQCSVGCGMIICMYFWVNVEDGKYSGVVGLFSGWL